MGSRAFRSPITKVGMSRPGLNREGAADTKRSMAAQSVGEQWHDMYRGTRTKGRGKAGEAMWNTHVVVAVS